MINDPKSASFENLALCFAVYFAATISVDDAEQQSVLMGHDKLELLHSFKLGLEQAFAHGDFLDRPTITGLHALAIYIVGWILTGTLLTTNIFLSSSSFE